MTGFTSEIDYIPLKHVCHVNLKALPEDTYEDLEIEYIDISAVNGIGTIAKPATMTFREAPSRARRIVRNGDVLISTVRTYLKAIAYVPLATENLICSTGFAVLSAGSNVVPRFLFYWVSSNPFVGEIVSRSVGVSYPAINPSELMSLPFPKQPKATQFAIADLLDHETEKIDNLIEKKQRLIELLDEKRAALISRAVTQGLDPSVPMKDSGVAWMGEVPAEWTEHRMSGLADFIGGSTPTIDRLDYWDGDIPWASPKDMKVNHLSQTEDHITPAALTEWGMRLLQPPAVLLVVRGMILAHSLPVAVALVPMTINQDMKALVVRSLCLPEFLMRWFQGNKHGIASLIEQSAHGTRCLRTDLLKQVKCFLPARDEQERICDFITDKAAATEATKNRLSTAIDRLGEYRSALITAAVTGRLHFSEHEKKIEALAWKAEPAGVVASALRGDGN